MSIRVVLTMAIAVVLFAGTAWADDKDKKEKDKEDYLAKIANGASGAVVKKDADGRIVACYVVGRSPISESLPIPKATEVAEKRAYIAAVAAFTKWLDGDVTVIEDQSDGVVTVYEGKKVSSKAIDKNESKFTSISKSLVRGLHTAYYDQNGDEKTYTLVLKWTAQNSEAAKKVKKDLNDPGSREENGKSNPKEGDKAKGTPKEEKIPNKKGVIPDNED